MNIFCMEVNLFLLEKRIANFNINIETKNIYVFHQQTTKQKVMKKGLTFT